MSTYMQPVGRTRHRACCAGVGARGGSAVDRLHARGCVAGAELWAVDSDRRLLETSAAPNAVLLEPVQARQALSLAMKDLLSILGLESCLRQRPRHFCWTPCRRARRCLLQ